MKVYSDDVEFGVKATKHTPFVWFMPNGELIIKGRSIPFDGALFYDELLDWILNYIKKPGPATVLTIELEYLNDISSKYLLRMMRLLNAACDQFTVKWSYDKEDEDILELAQLLSASSGSNFEFIEISA